MRSYFLALLAIFYSCDKSTSNMLPEPTPRIFTYLALGDSYTIGQSVTEASRWPNQLSDSLMADGIFIEKPRIIARTGWRTDQLQVATDTVSRKNWDLVTLLIGVNDFYQNGPVQTFQPKFEIMLDSAISFANGIKEHVLVVSIPDYGYTPFGQSNQPQISQGIAAYNVAIENVCNATGIAFISITDISQLGLQQPDLVASDGLHPSGKQYSLWVNRIRELAFFDQYK